MITFTLDLEDNRDDSGQEARYAQATHTVLDFLAERSIRGTVFAVGELARREPELIRECAAAGHELALHGDRHVPLERMTVGDVEQDARRGKATLEDLTGREVVGFRAPHFSLTRGTVRLTDVLASEGFVYSSSVIPARAVGYGFPGCPRRPFRWSSGLLELPVPVLATARFGMPYLGGPYLRLLPKTLIAAARKRSHSGQVLWTYCHPWDVDFEEPFRVARGHTRLESRLLWHRRDRMLEKLDWLLDERVAPPFVERALSGP